MKISYFITPYNRGLQTKRTLDRLMNLTLPDEVIVLDDDSSDNTEELLKDHPIGKKTEYRYLHRKKPEGIKYDACSIPRNICIKQAKYEYVLFSDPEVIFVTDVVKQFKEKAVEFPDHVLCAGIVYNFNEEVKMDQGIADDPKVWLSHQDIRTFYFGRVNNIPRTSVSRLVKWLATWACLAKKDWIINVGGWDEDMSLINGGGGWAWDDIDLMTRLRLSGHNQNVFDDIEVIHQYHERPPTAVSDQWPKNNKIFVDKDLENNPKFIVANQGRKWGKL